MTRNFASRHYRQRQRGISLVLGLIMLILLTLLAISAFQASNVNLRIAGNMQVRQETQTAAQTAIETVLSTSDFTTTPPAAASVSLNGARYTVDFTPAPACRSVVDFQTSDVDLAHPSPGDEFCAGGASIGDDNGNFGDTSVPFTPSAPAVCSNSRWAVIAHVADANTGADTTVEQGVAVRIGKGVESTSCP